MLKNSILTMFKIEETAKKYVSYKSDMLEHA